MIYSRWIALGIRENLKTWDGPVPLSQAQAACCIATIPNARSYVEMRKKIRSHIASQSWAQLKNISVGSNDDDWVSWYLIIGPGDHRCIVEIDSPYEFTRPGKVVQAWKLSKEVAEKVKAIGSDCYLLQPPKSLLGNLLNRLLK